MVERGIEVDHATIHRWAMMILPPLVKVFIHRKRPVGTSWRVDESTSMSAGNGSTCTAPSTSAVDFLLTARRDEAAARRLFERALAANDVPQKITIDKSGATTAAVHGLIKDGGVPIELRQVKYLNNIVEQDHRRPRESCARCWASSRSGLQRESLPESRPCT